MRASLLAAMLLGAATVGRAQQRLNLSQCSAPSICLVFQVPAIQFPDGSIINSATNISPGNLTGDVTSIGLVTTLAHIPVLSGANLTNLTPANISAGTAGINISGNSATVTTNANLSGNVTSVGNVTTIATIPAVSGAALTNLTAANISAGTAGINISGNAATVTTIPNLTGNVTSVGNATTIASIPAVSGALLTSLTAANISAGTAGINISGNAATVTTIPNLTGNVTSVGNVTTLASIPAISGAALTNLTAGNISAGVSVITGLGAQAQALNMNTHLINNVTDPVSPQDAATMNYVLTNLNGLEYKASARLATTAALPPNVYSNGASGVGATLTGVSIGLLTIDGATVNAGDRLLINNEAVAANNGIYTATTIGSLVAYVLTRATDYNQPSEMANGTALFIDSGTVNQNAGFVNTSSVATVGTSPINFSQFNGLGSVIAGPGISKSGNTLSVASPLPGPMAITAGGATSATTPSALYVSSGAFAFNYYGSSATVTSVAGQVALFSGRVYGGTLAAPTAVADGVNIVAFSGSGFDGSAFPTGGAAPGEIRFVSSGTYSTSNHGSTFRVLTTPIGSVTRAVALTITDAGAGVVPSSFTASAYFGDPSHMASGYVIVVSSYSGPGTSVASTTYVGIATVTVTLRGSRPLEVWASTLITSAAGGNRTYTCQMIHNGVAVDNPRIFTIGATTSGQINFPYFTSSSPSGSNTYGLECFTSSVATAQTAGTTYVIAKEY